MNANPEISFCSELSRLKRRLIVSAFGRILLNAGLIFLGISIIVFFIQKANLLNLSDSVSWAVFSIGFSLAAAVLLGLLKRNKFINTLIDIDRRLRLQDRISTAYEYYKSEKKTVLSDLQIQDAAAKLHPLSTKQMLPAKFSWLHLLLILLIVTNVALFFNDDLFPGFRPTRADQNKLEMAGALSRNRIISRLENKKEKKKKQQTNYSRELEDLRNKLNDPSITQDQRIKTLNRFLKEIQGEQTRQATELGAKLKGADIDETPVQATPRLDNLSPGQLEKLKIILDRVLDNQIPDATNQNTEALQELYRVEKRLSQMIDEFNDGQFDSDEVVGSKNDKPQSSTPSLRFKETNVGKELLKAKSEGSKRNRNITERPGQPGSEQFPEVDRDIKDEFGSQQGSSPTAGSDSSDGKKKSRHDLEKSLGTGTQDKTTPSQGDNYLIQIRSLTAIGKSKRKEEDIVHSYQKEIEGILQKEEIPLNYRGYIKNYFISIGLTSEKTVDGLK